MIIESLKNIFKLHRMFFVNICTKNSTYNISISYNFELREISTLMSLSVFVVLCMRINLKVNKKGHSNFLHLLKAKRVINAKIILKILIAPFQA